LRHQGMDELEKLVNKDGFAVAFLFIHDDGAKS